MELSKLPTKTAFERVAFVFQGGGALGAYQAGVFQAMSERDLTPDWIAGTSIGAINGAIIAGNKPENRVDRLKEFWSTVSETDLFQGLKETDVTQNVHSFLSVLQSMLMGRPGFFSPRSVNPAAVFPTGSAETASFYDTGPLRKTLEQLVDFELINEGPIRLSVGAVNITKGTLKYFDSKTEHLTPDHILASSALPPGFPAVRIGDDLYWDGGIYSNTPIEMVLEDVPRVNTLCLMLSLFNPAGAEPKSIGEAEERHKDIVYATRMQEHVRTYRRFHNLRRTLRSVYALLPEDVKNNPEIQELGEIGYETTMHIVQLIYPEKRWESCFKDADFSKTSIKERWSLGYQDACRLLEWAPWQNPVPRHIGVVVHTMKPSTDIKEANDLSFR